VDAIGGPDGLREASDVSSRDFDVAHFAHADQRTRFGRDESILRSGLIHAQ
jgi:hypothetical protein